ncbi:LOW QUALITY PROTEIN: steroid 17-alpha-hydroxylase/17,20 lyase-like [Mytilus galloprovincialis]|uniref:LOW QUALITY PROTEIN: steroid 17-alpha-hydroxylase/17,20 lyase-like n=1 Tax=Mytilus galloprovincialis TaxID=29158 RepID=UPI003F7B86B4
MESQIKNSLEDMKLKLSEEAGKSVDPAIIIEEFIMGTVEQLIDIHLFFVTRPELQKLLQTEIDIDNVIGSDRKLTLRDRENCPLIESVLLETLRYISHVPLSVFHFTADDCEINGYNIQKGTTIIPNLWNAHRNEKDFEHPYTFIPDRFLAKSGNLVPATDPLRKSLMPFGVGKRSCIGEVFARSRMFLFLATLLQTASIEKPDNEIIAEFGLDDLNPGLVMQLKPYKVKFVMRQ